MADPNHTTIRPLNYLYEMPKAQFPHHIIVHNNIKPTRRLNLNGFRVWIDPVDESNREICPCNWAPELGPHYRVASRYKT
jgi:hypothetical protein